MLADLFRFEFEQVLAGPTQYACRPFPRQIECRPGLGGWINRYGLSYAGGTGNASAARVAEPAPARGASLLNSSVPRRTALPKKAFVTAGPVATASEKDVG
jgi:hypothetical protein